MPEFIGPVEIPELPTIGPFPVTVPFGMVAEIVRPVVTHRMEAANGKRVQRFKLGPGFRRFRVNSSGWTSAEYSSLASWFESADGAYAKFPFSFCNAAREDETIVARFAEFVISFEHLVDTSKSGAFELVEVPSATATYSVSSETDRFPSAGLKTALLGGAQEIIPLLKITPKDPTENAIYLSDRRVTVGGNLYQPRILDYNPGTQSLGANGTDEAWAVLGNADGVISQLADEVNLHKAKWEFSYFHVGSTTKLNWWAGHIARFPAFGEEDVEGGTYKLFATDAAYELSLQIPGTISRRCRKKFNDGVHCPYASVGSGGDPTACEKTWAACQSHNMDEYFGGVEVPTQLVRVKDNSTGVRGFNRSSFQSATIANESVYDQVLPIVFTDSPMPVDCKVAGGRDEGDFYSAIGIVSEGPIGGFSADLGQHLLDGSPPHDPRRGGGWGSTLGSDPAGASDYFGISQHPWSGPSAFPNATFAAGVATAEIRRVDEKGLQLSKVLDRAMQVVVTGGRGGWTWSAPGSRTWAAALVNPVWIAVNMWLEAIGLKIDAAHSAGITAAEMEAHFDVAASIAAAAICDTAVASLVDGSSEPQFRFRGVLQERKPIREWLGEIMNTCVGTFWFPFGKFQPVIRTNATAVEAFGDGNVLLNGFRFNPSTPRFNRLEVIFGDKDWKFAANRAEYSDEPHAIETGFAGQPRFESLQMSSVGISTPSQAGRVAAVLTREELGGVTLAEWRKKGTATIVTTLLAANCHPGMVVSFQGRRSRNQVVKFRVREMTPAPDMTVTITGETATASMYDLTVGPDPVQAQLQPPDVETLPAPRGLTWSPGLVVVPSSDLATESWRAMEIQVLYPVEESASGVINPVLTARGYLAVNRPLPGIRPPEIRAVSLASGGSLVSGDVTYVAIAMYQANNEMSPLSNTVIMRTTTSGQKIVLSAITYPAGTWAGVRIYVGEDQREMTEWGSATGTPSTIEVDAPPRRFGRSTPPYVTTARVAVAAKIAVNLGVTGGVVTDVTGTTITAPYFGGDDWTGRHIAVIGKKNGGNIPAQFYKITAFNTGTGEATVADSTGVEVGDVVVILAIPTATTSTSITDAKFANASAPSGFATDTKANEMVRAINLDGRQQIRRIVSNTGTTLNVDRAWDETPNGWFIIEQADWRDWSGTARVEVSRLSQLAEVSIPTENLLDKPILIGGMLVDNDGVEAPDELIPFRMAWIYGAPLVEKSKTVTADVTIASKDKVIIAKAGSTTVTALDAADLPLETVKVINGGGGSKSVVIPGIGTEVLASDGDFITLYSDGTDWYITGRSGGVGGADATYYALTSASTIAVDIANGTTQEVTLAHNATFSAASNRTAGAQVLLIIRQDPTGGRVPSFHSTWGINADQIDVRPDVVTRINVVFDGVSQGVASWPYGV